MNRIWTKIVVAGLIILGEGALASESNKPGDGWYEAQGNVALLSQSVVQDMAESDWQPSLADVNTIQTRIEPARQTVAAVTTPAVKLLKHYSSRPRAPPTPAN